MAHVYRFYVTFEDEEDVSRTIEIKPNQTFQDLHDIILSSVGFKTLDHFTIFYNTDDQWHRNEEVIHNRKDVEGLSKKRIVEAIEDPHQRFVMLFNVQEPWFFLLEMHKIQIEDEKASYPRCVKSVGAAPAQVYVMPLPPTDMEEGDYLDEEEEPSIVVDQEAIDESEFDDINDGEKPV